MKDLLTIVGTQFELDAFSGTNSYSNRLFTKI
ncbi:hypothetical protein PN836_004445 [Ningiella sp. W23]